MTNQAIIDYYATLLIIQYANKQKAVDTIKALVTPVVMDQLPIAVQDAFDLETAEGVQLDTIGKYQNITRFGTSFEGPITLSDSDFRQLIKFAIIKNTGKSSLADIQNLLSLFFPGTFLVFDNQNMQMSFFFNSTFGSRQLAEMIVIQDLLPKPMAVGVGSVIYAPFIDNFFGFRSYTVEYPNVKGFNSYSDYQTDWPWLNYSYAIIIP